MKRFLPLLALLTLASATAQSQEVQSRIAQPSASDAVTTIQPDSVSTSHKASPAEFRKQRGLSNLKTHIVPKGQWIAGGTLSYSTHSNNSYKFLIIEGINSDGYTLKVSPLIGYAVAPNMAVGLRFGYSRSNLNVSDASLSITTLDNATYYSLKHAYNVAAFWRQYIPLGQNKRFAIFTEVQLALGGSQSKLAAGQPVHGVYARSLDVALNVNPGVVAFITNNMALELNIGVLGLSYANTRQVQNQVVSGVTKSSLMNFSINIFSIGLGVAFYL